MDRIRPAIFLLILAFSSLAFFLSADLYPQPKVLTASLAIILFCGALYFTVMTLIYTLTTEIAVTNRRVIVKTGLVRRRTSEMNMAKIESVDIDQSVLGRFLDFGTVVVRGTGAGLNPMRNISAPLAFRNSISAA